LAGGSAFHFVWRTRSRPDGDQLEPTVQDAGLDGTCGAPPGKARRDRGGLCFFRAFFLLPRLLQYLLAMSRRLRPASDSGMRCVGASGRYTGLSFPETGAPSMKLPLFVSVRRFSAMTAAALAVTAFAAAGPAMAEDGRHA